MIYGTFLKKMICNGAVGVTLISWEFTFIQFSTRFTSFKDPVLKSKVSFITWLCFNTFQKSWKNQNDQKEIEAYNNSITCLLSFPWIAHFGWHKVTIYNRIDWHFGMLKNLNEGNLSFLTDFFCPTCFNKILVIVKVN